MRERSFTIYDMIQRNAKLRPNEEAIVFLETRLSFAEYKEKCDELAAGLSERGIKPGDRIAIIADNSANYLILYGAASKIGAIILSINWRFQAEEISYVLKDCTPRMLFVGEAFIETVNGIRSDIDFVEQFVSTEANIETTNDYDTFESLYSKNIVVKSNLTTGDSPFVIMHTAAVDGRPKGAVLSQANCVYSSIILLSEFKLSPSDCHICLLPLFHVGGFHTALAVMHAGGKNIILKKFDATEALKRIQDEKGTIFVNFAPILGNLLDQNKEDSRDISSLKHVYGLDHPETIKRFISEVPSATYYTSFAQTEAMSITLSPLKDCPGSSGRPTILTEVMLTDDFDMEVPTGTPGEICVRSPTVFQGYWGYDEEKSYSFRNGWHHTGDIGKFDENGFLFYVKRKAQKALIKPGGENVYPAEVEKVIIQQGSVAEVCVIGVPDPKWGEAVKAICVLKPDTNVTMDQIIEYVGSKIARYKKPKHVEFVSALPRTDEGEVDREKIKEDFGGSY